MPPPRYFAYTKDYRDAISGFISYRANLGNIILGHRPFVQIREPASPKISYSKEGPITTGLPAKSESAQWWFQARTRELEWPWRECPNKAKVHSTDLNLPNAIYRE
jgi:hypothetical protein